MCRGKILRGQSRENQHWNQQTTISNSTPYTTLLSFFLLSSLMWYEKSLKLILFSITINVTLNHFNFHFLKGNIHARVRLAASISLLSSSHQTTIFILSYKHPTNALLSAWLPPSAACSIPHAKNNIYSETLTLIPAISYTIFRYSSLCSLTFTILFFIIYPLSRVSASPPFSSVLNFDENKWADATSRCLCVRDANSWD